MCSRLKSKELKELKEQKELQEQEEPITNNCQQSCLSSLSYAQAVGSAYQGIKRTVSDRFSVSPIDQDPKRSAKYSRVTRVCDSSPSIENQLVDLGATPLCTLDVDRHHNQGTSVCAQRRLFSSPNSNGQPTSIKARYM